MTYNLVINGDGGSRLHQLTGGLTAQVGWLDLRVGSPLDTDIHSLNEPGEFLQLLRHYDSTINIVPILLLLLLLLLSQHGHE